jgi:hypothetical protein
MAKRFKYGSNFMNTENTPNNANLLTNTTNSNITQEIMKKFKKYALIMHKVCKHNRKNMLKYLLLGDDIKGSKSNINTIKINQQALSKYYENEENFSKNQEIVEKVLMRPIFDPSTNRFLIQKDKDNQEKKDDIINPEPGQTPSTKPETNPKIPTTSIQQSQSSFYKKQNTSKCHNACGPNTCFIY